MSAFARIGLVSALVVASVAAFGAVAAADTRDAKARNAPQDTLTPFRSDAQLKRFLKRVRRAPPPVPAMAAPSPPAPAAADGAAEAPADASSSAFTTTESITNTQEAGVDEGGIVKVRGDILVVLRRGRLFTVSTKGAELKLVDVIDAYPPGAEAGGDWYDEMLIAGDRVVVIGYSYSRGGTEINRFKIDGAGGLSFEDAYHLKSNDYYSSRNYASRLIGTRLIVYAPLYIPYVADRSFDWLPALRRWSGKADAPFSRIVSAREIYLPDRFRRGGDHDIETIHTVTDCDLAAAELKCRGRSILGPSSRTFYVSANAVYVWVNENRWGRRDRERSVPGLLYRMPLERGAPSAIGVRGAPVDQFSFREDWEDGRLNVLVRSDGGGDAMWRPEFSEGAVALLRFPLSAFGDGEEEAGRSRYRTLPRPAADAYHFQNRFVGDYVLYGTGNSWGRPEDRNAKLVVVPVKGGEVSEFPLDHGVDRIEAMGREAVVVGGDARDLHFRAVELTSGPRPVFGDRYTMEGASQGETRSHAFFFKPESRADDTTAGVLGLPVARAARPAWRHLVESSAAILFLRRANRKFSGLGELNAEEARVVDDGCKASCVDWYGNARPIFLRGRVFALMGYEIVEGELGERSIRELRRFNFAPPPAPAR